MLWGILQFHAKIYACITLDDLSKLDKKTTLYPIHLTFYEKAKKIGNLEFLHII